ncbi:MAG: ECF-type sigma factor [Hyphomicrobiales bacterium]
MPEGHLDRQHRAPEPRLHQGLAHARPSRRDRGRRRLTAGPLARTKSPADAPHRVAPARFRTRRWNLALRYGIFCSHIIDYATFDGKGGVAIEPRDEARSAEPTRILLGTRAGSTDGDANLERLITLVYDDLRSVASRAMRDERAGHTLTPTALVHEVYLRLVDESRIDWTDRARFFAIAARAMRQILVDHARARAAAKRGGGLLRVTISGNDIAGGDGALDALALSDAFERLGARDERAASVAEMRVFGGLTHEEIAHALGVSRRTVDSDWTFARRWLSRALAESG